MANFVLGNPTTPGQLTLGTPLPNENAPAPETIVPKGQLPRQLNVREQKQWAVFDQIARKQKQLQDAVANERASTIQAVPGTPFPLNKIIPAADPFLRAGARELGDAVVGAPALAANTMNAIPRTVGNLISPGLGDRIAPKFTQPTFNDVLAPIQAGTAGTSLADAKQALDVGQQAQDIVHPYSSDLGRVAGDVATIAGPRAMMAEDLVRGFTNSPDARRLLSYQQGAGVGGREQFAAAWSQPWAQRLRRGLGKVGETGLEQGILSTLHGSAHPLVNAAISGGLQMAGNVALTPLVMFPKTASTATAVMIGALATTAYSDVLGGKTGFMGNLNDAIHALGWGSAVGAMAALSGAGRYRGSGEPFGAGAVVGGTRPAFLHHEFARRLPAVAESVNAALRTIPNSIIRQIMGDQKTDNPVIMPTLSQIATRGENFTPKEIDMLGRGIQKSDARGTIQRMFADKSLVDANGTTFAQRMGMQ